MERDSDEDLVRRIAKGDNLAMRVLYARHHLRAFRFLQRLLKDEALAEDALSEVFLDVWRQAGSFEGRSSVSTWLLAMARNKAWSALRKRRESALDEGVAEAMEDEGDDPEVQLQKSDKGAAIRACMDKLSAEHREVLDLVYYHETSVEEVAMIISIPENTVKTRLFHARKKLAELLKVNGIDRGVAMSTILNETEREIEDLLPFYHNGRLSAADRARVDAALQASAELRRRLDLIAEEAEIAIAMNEAVGAPSPRAFDALMAKIEAEPKHAAHRLDAVKLGFMERLGGLIGALSPRKLAYATAAMVAIIAAQGVVITGVVPGGPDTPQYQTASAPAQSEGSFVLVSFAPEAKASAVAELLKSVNASIVEGPRPSGLYRVRIGEKTLPKDEAERIVARLQAARDVVALVAPDR